MFRRLFYGKISFIVLFTGHTEDNGENMPKLDWDMSRSTDVGTILMSDNSHDKVGHKSLENWR